jgi:hypothetical protein
MPQAKMLGPQAKVLQNIVTLSKNAKAQNIDIVFGYKCLA